MESILLYSFFVMLECLAIFVLMFQLFSFRFKEYIPEIIFSSIFLTFISYSFRYNYDLGSISPIVQLVLLIILLWLVFKVHFFYAALMSMTMLLFAMTQAVIFFVMLHLGIVEMPITTLDMYEMFGMYLVEIVTILFMLVLTLILKKFDIRYTFVPNHAYFRGKYSNTNLALISIVITELLLVCFSYYTFISGRPYTSLVGVALIILLLVIYFYFISKKEFSRD